ncbi:MULTISPECIES: hypothetical protein [Anoxybacillaceae]|uniref:Uncharacterized protein n=1 Tax=Geobacillus thermodenitrificans (strain NG80-2) TaxID=420246 RepID=A4IQ05_GEOTN|nr:MULTISPECIES: hypothetical protein [Bacillaceae]ABO67409.1 hypothetical protein GTNG_2057 [Geobacillus thermodenitrificans NG80-2]MED0661411.1 hypothetical protein [Geobacillus thermodenitrificans]
MKVKLMNYFKKQSDLEKLMAEKQALENEYSEMTKKVNQVQSLLNLAQAELMVDSSTTNKKKVDKFKEALEKLEKERATVLEKVQKVAVEIARLNMEKRKAEIEAIADNDVERFEEYYRSYKLKKLWEEKVSKIIHQKTKILDATTPKGLLKEAGVEIGHFDKTNEAHKPYLELWERKRAEVEEQVEKELAELEKQLEDFLG